MPVISGSDTRSGITSLPTRVTLRELDIDPGRYPTILRTGDPDRRGSHAKPFDDTYVITFLTSSMTDSPGSRTFGKDIADMTLVQYPQLLLSSGGLERFGTYVASPNSHANIVTIGSMRLGISDGNLASGWPRGYYDPITKRYIPDTSPFRNDETPQPFDESRIYLQDTPYYLTGTMGGVFPGLRDPLKSKISFKISLSSSREQVFTRAPKERLNVLDPSGQFYDQDITGFSYYNFNLQRWDQIGLTDAATGGDIKFDWAGAVRAAPEVSAVAAVINAHSGTNNWPQQFLASPQGVPLTSGLARKRNYPRVGVPSVTNLAPFSTKYHATSSQTMKMSNFINHPFLLEKLVVDLPIQAQRKHRFKSGSAPTVKDRSAERDQDDWMFFIYRQQRRLRPGSGPDSRFDVSGSSRFLVCSGAMTFYNSKIAAITYPGIERIDFEPINTPAFSHDYNMPITNNTTEYLGEFTGSVRLQLTPAVAAPQFLGVNYVPRSTGKPGMILGSSPGSGAGEDRNAAYAILQHYWPGGTSIRPFLQETQQSVGGKTVGAPSKYTGKVGVSASYGDNTFSQFDIGNMGATRADLPIEVFDTRAHIPFGGDSDPVADPTYKVSLGSDVNRLSPYLLFPEDEIVFGIDSALSIRGILNTFSSSMATQITSSQLTVMPGKASVTFFGSLLRENRGVSPISLSQQLTSNAIHEAISSGPIVDQYDIELTSAYTGSYIDVVIGSPGTSGFTRLRPTGGGEGSVGGDPAGEIARTVDTRSVIGSAAGGPGVVAGAAGVGTTGSLLRGVRLSDAGERFYDTVMPNIPPYVLRSGFISTYNPATNLVKTEHGVFQQLTSSMPWPYVGDPERVLASTTKIQMGRQFGPFSATNTGYRFRDPSDIRKVLFSVGWSRVPALEIDSSPAVKELSYASLTGSSGMKYGVLSYEPLYTSSVFRRDHYGQYRDMLEQRLFSKFYTIQTVEAAYDGAMGFRTEGVSTMSPVEVKFVQMLTNQRMTPDGIWKKDTDAGSGGTFGALTFHKTQSSNKSLFSTSSLPYDDRNNPRYDPSSRPSN